MWVLGLRVLWFVYLWAWVFDFAGDCRLVGIWIWRVLLDLVLLILVAFNWWIVCLLRIWMCFVFEFCRWVCFELAWDLIPLRVWYNTKFVVSGLPYCVGFECWRAVVSCGDLGFWDLGLIFCVLNLNVIGWWTRVVCEFMVVFKRFCWPRLGLCLWWRSLGDNLVDFGLRGLVLVDCEGFTVGLILGFGNWVYGLSGGLMHANFCEFLG